MLRNHGSKTDQIGAYSSYILGNIMKEVATLVQDNSDIVKHLPKHLLIDLGDEHGKHYRDLLYIWVRKTTDLQ